MQSGLTGLVPDTYISCDTKQRIAFNFSRAASTYDDAATLQKRVATHVMQSLPECGLVHSVLDLGAGTGSHSRGLSLRYPDAQVTGMDLAMGMLEFARHQSMGISSLPFPPLWCSGDIEALPFRESSFDLVFSSLAIQWCQLDRVLREVYRVLAPGGQFAFSTLAGGSLQELDLAWQTIGETNRVNHFDSIEHQCRFLEESNFKLLSFTQQVETLHFPKVTTLLKGLKALGVNTVLSGRQGLMTRSKLQGLQEAYESYRTKDGLPLTYQVIYGVLQKAETKGEQ
ncbi:malonyl-[acyl-carrier protein] O-methyltransferase BioC [Endozoicomonas sp. (ex Bugula neritina AB1)]|nr:malonyl-[acyl-carrier protein] O-methyltransferase BioC [Endozoicomonas sp. (ex Bugula neritina AB1)]